MERELSYDNIDIGFLPTDKGIKDLDGWDCLCMLTKAMITNSKYADDLISYFKISWMYRYYASIKGSINSKDVTPKLCSYYLNMVLRNHPSKPMLLRYVLTKSVELVTSIISRESKK